MKPGRPSQTANQNALFRAIEARRPPAERVADDPFAVALVGPRFRVIAEAARVAPVRAALEQVIDHRWPCVRAGVVVRTRVIDDAIAEAASAGELDQVLILGAGLDTRALRLGALREVPVFEVDHPATQTAKRRALADAPAPATATVGGLADHVRFVPVRFGTDDPARALEDHGFRSPARTLVLWEGTTNYLDAPTVAATFSWLSAALAPGSPILFTYVDRRMLDGSAEFDGARTTMQAVRNVGEPFTFGLLPDELGGYLAVHELTLEWDTTVAAAAPRFYAQDRVPRAPAYYHVAAARRA